MNLFVLVILGYLLYRFIAGFLVPLFRTTSQMRQQFHNMNRQPPAGDRPGNPSNSGNGAPGAPDASKSGASKVGEYIDFEEIK
jgi:hypothetical protein